MPRTVKPSVVVGLGGTGLKVIMRLRRLLEETYGTAEASALSQLPLFQFLYIDTDESDVPDFEMPEELHDRVALSAAERYSAAVRDVYRLWDHFDDAPGLKEWLPDVLRGMPDLTRGAKQIRALGRLAFHQHFNDIRTRLRQAADRAISEKNHEMLRPRQLFQMDSFQNLRFYVISSACGGTGSGMFLDLGYLTRQVYDDRVGRGGKSPTTAYLSLPDVYSAFNVEDRIGPNGFAALRELDYHNRTQTRFHATYSGDHELEMSGPPFDLCYLVGISNEHINFADALEDFYQMMAHQLLLNLTSVDEDLTSGRVNIAALEEPDKHGFPRRYLAFGLSSAVLPADHIKDACMARLAGSVLNVWLSSSGDSSTSEERRLREAVERFLDEEAHLGENEKRHDIVDRLVASCEKEIDDWGENLAKRALNADWDSLAAGLPSVYQDQCSTLAEGPERAVRGKRINAIHDRLPMILDDIVKTVKGKVSELLTAGQGPEFAIGFLEEISRRLDVTTEQFREIRKEDSKVRQQTQRRKERTEGGIAQLAEYAGTFTFAKGQVMAQETRKWAMSAIEAQKDLLHLAARGVALELIAELKRRLQDLTSRVETVERLIRDRRDYFNRSREKAEERASRRDVVNGTLLFTPGEQLEKYYQSVLGRSPETEVARDIARKVLGEDSVLDLASPSVRPKIEGTGELWRLCRQRVEETLQPLLVAARVIAEMPLAEQSTTLGNVQRMSQAMLPSSRNEPELGDHAFLSNRVVRLHGGASPGDDASRQVVTQLQKLGYDGNDLRPLDNPSVILFSDEMLVFPLRALSQLEQWHRDYKRHTEVSRIPLHIRSQYAEGLPPLTYEEALRHREEVESQETARMEAHDLCVLAGAFGVWCAFSPERVVYSYRDDTGLPAEVELGASDNMDGMVVTLVPLDVVRNRLREELLERRLSTGEATDGLRHEATEYLEALAKQLKGGKTNDEYEGQRRLLGEYIKGEWKGSGQ